MGLSFTLLSPFMSMPFFYGILNVVLGISGCEINSYEVIEWGMYS